MLINRRLLPHIDWVLIVAISALLLISLGMIYSATFEPTTGEIGAEFSRQLLFLAIGVAA